MFTNEIEIDLNEVSVGLYFIKITSTDNKIFTKRILKNKKNPVIITGFFFVTVNPYYINILELKKKAKLFNIKV